MNFRILNGVLFVGQKRILLAHVTSYSGDHATLAISQGNAVVNIGMGADCAKCVEAMDTHFLRMFELAHGAAIPQ